MDIARRRLHQQHIETPLHGSPADLVGWMVALQAQEYAAAKWAVGLRLLDATDAAIERAYDDGAILRTHLLRPTWHFVTPQDIRWLLALTAPRVLALNAYMLRQLALDAPTLVRSNDVIAGALAGGQHRTRAELAATLQANGIATAGETRLSYHLMQAELDGLICSGPRRGNQFTYALLEERVPPVAPFSRDEALAELARRFFQSHGPATVQDLAKWSGLTVADATLGLDAVAAQLDHDTPDGRTYWFAPAAPPTVAPSTTAHLLSIFDEYFIGYHDRSAIVSDKHAARLVAMDNALRNIIVVDGRIVGTWRRTLRKTAVTVETNLFIDLTDAAHHAVAAAAQRYAAFLGLPVILR